jgi:UDP-glucose 4-epimerase
MQTPGIRLFLFGKNERSIFGDAVPYIQIDLTDKKQVTSSFAGIDLVYYLASTRVPATSWDKPSVEIEENLLPFINFMECLKDLDVKKVAFVSSAGTIYGPSKEKVSEEAGKHPFSPHGITKLAMEYFLDYFRIRYNINFDIYRVSNVYGEGQDIKKGIGIINTFLEHIVRHRRLQVFGNGENVRNYLYVKDFADLISMSLNSDPSTSEVYNMASGDTLSINELVETMKRILHEDFDVVYTAARQSDNPVIRLDNSKLLRVCPDFKFTPLEQGILKTYDHIRQYIAAEVS